jgi:hypothetical protein
MTTDLGVSSAICTGVIVGLLSSAVVPSFSILLGIAVALGVTAIVLFGRAAFAPDEDTEPEVRPPDFRTRYGNGTAVMSDKDDY